jgi:hypothetical protein
MGTCDELDRVESNQDLPEIMTDLLADMFLF